MPDRPAQDATSTPGSDPADLYTVHDDADHPDRAAAATSRQPPRSTPHAGDGEDPPVRGPRAPDPVGLVVGVAALIVAALALTDTLGTVDVRWLVATSAIVGGLGILLATMIGRSR